MYSTPLDDAPFGTYLSYCNPCLLPPLRPAAAHSVHSQNLVLLADIRAITDGDRQIVLRNPVGCVAVSDRAFDDLLHEEVGHRVRGSERDVASALEKFLTFSFRRKC